MKIKKHIISTKIDGEIVLLNLENGMYYSINEIGSDIFSKVENSSIDEIVEYLSNTYPKADKSEIKKDVEEFIENLVSNKVLE